MSARRLRDLGLESHYRSGERHLVRDFYRPCLSIATGYDRAVGYFTSSSLAAAASGVRPFINRDGARMRLVASPQLTNEDVAAIAAGYDARILVETRLLEALQGPAPDPIEDRLRLLSWLIEHERLDIKIALLRSEDRVGIYHEKLGIFRDSEGDEVVFFGSANESVGGLLANFESVEVFRSWDPGDAARVERRTADFSRLWNDATPGLRVFEFPEAVRDEIINRYTAHVGRLSDPDDDGFDEANPETPLGVPRLPGQLELRPYQREAIEAWFSAGGKGIWEMATGTGKTITALAAVTQLYRVHRDQGLPLSVVVLAPFVGLVEQWVDEARNFGVEAIPCHSGEAGWRRRVGGLAAAVASGGVKFACLVTTNDTFTSDQFQTYLGQLRRNLLVIADEVHNAGANKIRRLLPDSARYRLGLSATPDRHMDPGGTEAIRGFFGRSVFSLTLLDAVRLGALVPYRYWPVTVELTDDELDQYVDLSQQIARAMGSVDDLDPAGAPTALETLLFKRARLIGSAVAKVDALAQHITPYVDEPYTLVYCADRDTTFTDEPQLDRVVRLLGRDLAMRVNTYTNEEPSPRRRVILERFAAGDLQALAAIRCLDEGVDIPATRRAFILASTTNPRQFIQRRGRVLRPAPGKTRAEIFDFMVIPPDLSDDRRLYEVERRLVGRELARVVELCEAAINGPEALASLLPLRERYALLGVGAPSSGGSVEVESTRRNGD